MNGELRLADGTPVGKVVEWRMEHEPVGLPKPDFRSMFNKPVDANASFTSSDLTGLIDIIRDHYPEPQEIYCYAPNHMYWMLQYAAQGKRYPRPRKRKSKARMSRKWRDRA